ncbi:MAG: mycofactocin biosynthesis peptidyl-dipeptidase MftE [Actinomycetota bacterium]
MSSTLGRAVWPEVDPARTLLIPLGSTEQHGPHLPLDTDTRIALAVADRAAEESGATRAPVVAYGASGEHADFAGTLSIGTEVLRLVIVELMRSAALTWSRVIFVNGHGGNHPALSSAIDQLRAEGHEVQAWWPRIPGGDAHAGRSETSLMLAIAPDLVRLDLAEPGNTAALIELLPVLQAQGVRAASPNGVLGDPSGASADEGRDMLDGLVEDLLVTIDPRRARAR